jgi:hypothetical protein
MSSLPFEQWMEVSKVVHSQAKSVPLLSCINKSKDSENNSWGEEKDTKDVASRI